MAQRKGPFAGPLASRKPRPLFLCFFSFGVLAAEALNAAGRIHNLLLAGEKRMATRADFHVDIAFMRGTGGKNVAACALHAQFVICWVNSWLHDLVDPSPESLILQEKPAFGQITGCISYALCAVFKKNVSIVILVTAAVTAAP
jgi:hypothetical protein